MSVTWTLLCHLRADIWLLGACMSNDPQSILTPRDLLVTPKPHSRIATA